jgi:hypothetical protein
MPRPILGPTQFPVQWEPWDISPGLRDRCVMRVAVSCSVEAKNTKQSGKIYMFYYTVHVKIKLCQINTTK